jgi:hypothetical protein
MADQYWEQIKRIQDASPQEFFTEDFYAAVNRLAMELRYIEPGLTYRIYRAINKHLDRASSVGAQGIVAQYQALSQQLRFAAIEFLSEGNLAAFIESFYVRANQENEDITSINEKIMNRILLAYPDERKTLVWGMLTALKKNQEMIGRSVFVDTSGQQKSPTVANWLANYDQFFGVEPQSNADVLRYFNQNQKVSQLEKSEKELIRLLIELYEELKIIGLFYRSPELFGQTAGGNQQLSPQRSERLAKYYQERARQSSQPQQTPATPPPATPPVPRQLQPSREGTRALAGNELTVEDLRKAPSIDQEREMAKAATPKQMDVPAPVVAPKPAPPVPPAMPPRGPIPPVETKIAPEVSAPSVSAEQKAIDDEALLRKAQEEKREKEKNGEATKPDLDEVPWQFKALADEPKPVRSYFGDQTPEAQPKPLIPKHQQQPAPKPSVPPQAPKPMQTSDASSQQAERIYQQIARKESLGSLSEDQQNRLRVIIGQSIRGLKQLHDVEQTLVQSFAGGGIGLAKDQAVRITEMLAMLIGKPRKQARPQIRPRQKPQPAPRPSVTPQPKLQPKPQPKLEQKPESKPNLQPAPMPTPPSQPKPEPKRSPGQRLTVQSVAEISQLNMQDFRAFGQFKHGAGLVRDASRQLIETLEDVNASVIIEAWKKSEPYQLYIEIGRKSMMERKSVGQLARERKEEGKPYLTEEEFVAIADLSKQIQAI